MILIIAEDMDLSTKEVLDWITYYQKPFLKIGQHDKIQVTKLYFKNQKVEFEFVFQNKTYQIDQFEAIWLRRGVFGIDTNITQEDFLQNELTPLIEKVLQTNYKTLSSFLYLLLEQCPRTIGTIRNAHLNKMEQLFYAQKVGLTVPETLITSDKSSIQAFEGN